MRSYPSILGKPTQGRQVPIRLVLLVATFGALASSTACSDSPEESAAHLDSIVAVDSPRGRTGPGTCDGWYG